MKDQVKICFPDKTSSEAEIQYNENSITIITETGEQEIAMSTIGACAVDKNDATVCLMATTAGKKYRILFENAKKANRFCGNVIAEMDASNEAPTKDGKKKLPGWAWIAIIIGVVAIATAVTVILVLHNINKTPDPVDPSTQTDPTSTTEAPEVYDQTSPMYLSNYSTLEASPDDEVMNTFIAFDADGNGLLKNKDLQHQYWMAFYQFMGQYSSYASMFGLDATKNLAEQEFYDGTCTWEQYFLECAQVAYGDYYALTMDAKANNFELEQMWKDALEDLHNPNGEFAAEAANNNFDSADAYLQEQFGKGVDVESYYNYLQTYYLAMSYYDQICMDAESKITPAAAEAHYDANAGMYEAANLPKVNNVSVRHILIQPEGEADDAGEFTEAQMKEAKAKADEILAKWLEDPTEENFAALANEYSTDPGSNGSVPGGGSGGIYEDFAPGRMVQPFNDWSFDESRQYGDYGIVETDFGYHIMFFVEHTETRAWYDKVVSEMADEMINEKLAAIREEYPVTFDFSKVKIFDMITEFASHIEDAQ